MLFLAFVVGKGMAQTGDYNELDDGIRADVESWNKLENRLYASWASRDVHYVKTAVPQLKMKADTTVYAWRGERVGVEAVLFSPVVLLYFLIKDILDGTLEGNVTFYVSSICIWIIMMTATSIIQYNTCFFSTYKESGVRRITLAEKLRKLPLSFFAKKDSADLTSTLMDDAASIEQSSSHFIPQLIGSIISTCILATYLFFVNWKMALAAVWVLPVSLVIVALSRKVQYKLGKKKSIAAIEMTEQIQECLEESPRKIKW